MPRAAQHAAAGKRSAACALPRWPRSCLLGPQPCPDKSALRPGWQRELVSLALDLPSVDRAETAEEQSAHEPAGAHPLAPHLAVSCDTVPSCHEEPLDDATESLPCPLVKFPWKQDQHRDRGDPRIPLLPQQHARAGPQNACPAKRAAEQVLHRDDTDPAQFPWGDSAPPVAPVALENGDDHFGHKRVFVINHTDREPTDAHVQEPGLTPKDTTNLRETEGELIDAQEDQHHGTSQQVVGGMGKADSSSIHSQEEAAVAVPCQPRESAQHPTSAHAHADESGWEKQHPVRKPLSLVRDNGEGQVASPQESQCAIKSARPNGCRALQKERSTTDRQAAHGVGVTGSHLCRDYSVRAQRQADGFKKKYLALMGGGGEAILHNGPSRFLNRSTVSGNPRLGSALAS